MKGKKFFYWLGVIHAANNKPQARAAVRQAYEGQKHLVFELWQKVEYLSGYWQTRNSLSRITQSTRKEK